MPVVVQETKIPGVTVIRSSAFPDDRGYFTEAYNEKAWGEAGFSQGPFVQDNLSFNDHRGTMRGLHYQLRSHPQGKLVRVLRGAVFDVAVDIRKDSPTYKQWVGVTLRPTLDGAHKETIALWIPKGFAHGYMTLEDDTVVVYKCDDYWSRDYERSLRYDDPEIGIEWRAEGSDVRPDGRYISEKDRDAPLLADADDYYDD